MEHIFVEILHLAKIIEWIPLDVHILSFFI